MYQNDALKVLTGECRLSYCNLTTPRAAQQGGEPRYSVTLLIPKSDAATKADIDSAIQAAASEALSKVWNGARPPMLKVPIYDGDGVRPSGVPFGDECKGHGVRAWECAENPGWGTLVRASIGSYRLCRNWKRRCSSYVQRHRVWTTGIAYRRG